MDTSTFDRLRLELSVNAKNGIDFICSATVVWLLLAYIWTLPYSDYDRSVLTFIAGSITIPLAFVLSKVFKTQWKTPGNPLEPLGLWLNFAQLFYFPILVFMLLTNPTYFVKSTAFAVMAGVIAVGAMFLGFALSPADMYLLPLAMAGSLAVLAVLLWFGWQNNARALAHATGKH